jgi:hypothetical protein
MKLLLSLLLGVSLMFFGKTVLAERGLGRNE